MPDKPTPSPSRNTETDRRWLAAHFDANGSVTIQPKQVRLVLFAPDDLTVQFHERAGCGLVRGQPGRWGLWRRAEVEAFVEAILPFSELPRRRQELQAALDHLRKTKREQRSPRKRRPAP